MSSGVASDATSSAPHPGERHHRGSGKRERDQDPLPHNGFEPSLAGATANPEYVK
jgi:hypothetical protein